MKHLKISYQKHLNRQSIIVIQEHDKLCENLLISMMIDANFTEAMKVVENLLKSLMV